MEQNLNNTFQEEKEEGIDVKALIVKYIVYWQWFVVSVVCVVALAWIYLRFTTPIYSVSAAVLIQEEDNRSHNSGTNPFSAIQDFGMFSMTSNFDNEVEVLHSRTLLKEVVTSLNLYTSVNKKSMFGYDAPLYKNSPVDIYMTAQEASELKSGIRLDIDYKVEGETNVELTYYIKKEKNKQKEVVKTFPAVITTPLGVITLSRGDSIAAAEDCRLQGFISNPMDVAMGYANNLTVEPTSKTTTIAQITLKDANVQRGLDFVNTLVERYNQNANEDKNEVASRTAEFIEERLKIIDNELGHTETELANFKRRSGLTDLESNAKLSLEENASYNQQRVKNETQISLVRYLLDYINDPKNINEVIPVNVGLEDQKLSTVMEQYNTLLSEKKRLLLTSSEANPAVKKISTSLEAMRTSVKTTVRSVYEGLLITKKDLDRQASKFESRISEAPEQEKEFVSISRQQEIKATLYTMLLQKREENAITLASTANNGRIIEEALAGRFPVSPKRSIILLAALILGIAIPVGIIYIRDLLKYKIENREDVEKITKATILGEIPLANKEGGKNIVLKENRNEMMEEVFRGIRTNLLFTLKPEDKVIMFSSTMPGEGKSFVAGNMAVSLAFMGKKVIIVGMDIRKPGLNKVFNLSKRMVGVTNYLRDPKGVSLDDLIQPSGVTANLDVLPGGAIAPNPTELVARPALNDLAEELKKRYDYVIYDTAPLGMVSDSALIARTADAVVYICRADYTPKEGFAYINQLKDELKIDNICTIINSIDMSLRKNHYGYGYGKKYGYGYGRKYGYGYGYGYGSHTEDADENDGKGKEKK